MSAQAPKPKDVKKAKAPTAAKPKVQTAPTSHVKPVGSRQPEAQKTSDQQLVQGFRTLQSVKKTLMMADHDYGGHKADAMRDIGKAEMQVQEALKFQSHKSPKGGPMSPQWHPEPQRLSNAQLGSAIPILHKTIAAFEKADSDYGGHKAHAMADLKIAVAQLKEALRHSK